jgi:DNA polymerase V
MSNTPPKRGGFRPGAGRKPGSGTYGEPTQAIRVPVSLLPAVRAWLKTAGKVPPHADIKLPSTLPAALSLPLYASRVAAGFPSPADDHLEDTLDLNEHLVRHPAATFFVRVQGDSMTGAGIHHGDLLVVDRSLEPKSGAIVIAVVNGELTVKRLKVDHGGVWLMPENPNYPPLEIKEGTDLMIWGVVAHVVHSL